MRKKPVVWPKFKFKFIFWRNSIDVVASRWPNALWLNWSNFVRLKRTPANFQNVSSLIAVPFSHYVRHTTSRWTTMISVFFRFSQSSVLVPPLLLLPLWLWLLFCSLSAALHSDDLSSPSFIGFCLCLPLFCSRPNMRWCECVAVCSSTAYFRFFDCLTRLTIHVWMSLFTPNRTGNAWACRCARASRVCTSAKPLYRSFNFDEEALIIIISNRCWCRLFALCDDNKTKINFDKKSYRLHSTLQSYRLLLLSW